MVTHERSGGRTRRKAIGAVVVLVLVALAVIAHLAFGGMSHHGLHSTQASIDGGGA